MKARLFPLSVALFTLMAVWLTSTCTATVITFDDLVVTSPGNGAFITNTYQGLVWSNFGVLNAVAYTGLNGSNGYYNGMVSVSNVALNAFGAPAEIDSSTNFNFLSAYLTGAWNSNLNIQVQGFSGGAMLYDTTVVASATSPTLFTFNYLNIDRLHFDSFGGEYAGFPAGSATHFAMDNFTFEFIPEPSSLLLASLGALLVWPLLKRKRA
jgi:hypothetical protein